MTLRDLVLKKCGMSDVVQPICLPTKWKSGPFFWDQVQIVAVFGCQHLHLTVNSQCLVARFLGRCGNFPFISGELTDLDEIQIRNDDELDEDAQIF